MCSNKYGKQIILEGSNQMISIQSLNHSLGLMPFKEKFLMGKPIVFSEQKEQDHKPVYGISANAHIMKDKRKIKEAVKIQGMKLVSKGSPQSRKIQDMSPLKGKIKYLGCSGLNRLRNQKEALRIGPSQIFTPFGTMNCNQNFNNSLKEYLNCRNHLKLEKIDKENEVILHQIEPKPNMIAYCKSQAMINIKLKHYLNSVQEGRKFHNFKQELKKQSKKRCLRVKIKKGNNFGLVKWLFKKRWWWTVEEDKDDKEKCRYNFIWSQLKEKPYFQQNQLLMETENSEPFCHNHFQHNEYLGNKKALFYNMTHYYKSKEIDVFNKLPLTFHVESLKDESWNNFQRKYEQFSNQGKGNIWILKPGENSNRGRGITVHQKIQEIKAIIQYGQTSVNDVDSSKKMSYIIQSYIDQPFLYNKRKFDIRCYMLLVNINNSVKGYWYKEGYIRTSSFEFQLQDFNTFVHLTNDAIQTNSESYGKFQEGNKLSYSQFQKYLDLKHGQCSYDFESQIVPKMKEVALESMKAAVGIVKGNRSNKPVFQVFGLDFMIDRDFKPWLIEINTNPCIETSSRVLKKIIPNMLDQAFKLSLDILFPPPENWPPSRKHCLPSQQIKFELIYDQAKEQYQNIIDLPSMGAITQDNQFFDDKEFP